MVVVGGNGASVLGEPSLPLPLPERRYQSLFQGGGDKSTQTKDIKTALRLARNPSEQAP
jgi:hypothetical protein